LKAKSYPQKIKSFLQNAAITKNLNGYSNDEVFFVQKKTGNYYLKIKEKKSFRSLAYEVRVLGWLEGKIPAPTAVLYECDEAYEFLVMSEIAGDPPFSERFRNDRLQAVRELARTLRLIHRLDIRDCELVQDLDFLLKAVSERVFSGKVDEGRFEGKYSGLSGKELYSILERKDKPSQDLVFTHGDFCLPNILLVDLSLSGVIDWGSAGIADRYQDLALAYRSLKYNQFSDNEIDCFFGVYGVSEIDRTKIEYYILLDEFF